MNKETALHNIALYSSKLFIEANLPEYKNSKDGFNSLVSDFTARYVEAYNQAEKDMTPNTMYV